MALPIQIQKNLHGEGLRTFVKTSRSLELFFLELSYNQQKDEHGFLADTLLICSDGVVRAHAFMLQAASPFLRKVLHSQGENYPYLREILLPDMHMDDVQVVMQLVYNGCVNVNGDKYRQVEGILKLFQISSFDVQLTSVTDANQENLPRQQQGSIEGDTEVISSNESESWEHALQTNSSNPGESDNALEVAEETTPQNNGIPYKLKKRQRLEHNVDDHGESPSGDTKNLDGSTGIDMVCVPYNLSGSVQRNYLNYSWLFNEANRCQICCKSFETHEEANSCIKETHDAVRCYLCMAAFHDLHGLLRHYEDYHESPPGDLKNVVTCPFCRTTILHQFVQSHVVKAHLTSLIDRPIGTAKSTYGTEERKRFRRRRGDLLMAFRRSVHSNQMDAVEAQKSIILFEQQLDSLLNPVKYL